jgi:hypothetical protein
MSDPASGRVVSDYFDDDRKLFLKHIGQGGTRDTSC